MARVLLAIDSLQLGGAERHVVDLATALRDRGNDVGVACSAAGPLAEELRARRIRLHVLAPSCVKRRTSLRYAHELRRLVRRERPDVVHAHLYASGVAAAFATFVTGIPLVVTEQTEAPWRSARARLTSRFVYRRAAAVIAVSNAIRDVLLTRYGVPAERVRIVRNSVRPMPAASVARNGPTVGAIARLHPEKGLTFLLDAAPRIAALVPDVRFVIVGEGPLRDELEAHAARTGIADRIRFEGGRDDARELIAGFDVLALPSISEGTPLTIVEAMLAEIPVVASAVGGIPEQIEDRRTGFLVPPCDAESLATATVAALTDDPLVQRVRRAARAHAEVEFSHARMVERIAALYREVRASSDAASTPQRAALEEPETTRAVQAPNLGYGSQPPG